MPSRNKRKIEEFDPTKSDSDDSTYGASSSRAVRSKPSRSQKGKPARKRQRRQYDGDDSEDISDASEISEASLEEEEAEEEEEQVELDERTGRPKRRAAKKRPTYQESDEDEVMEESAEDFVAPKKKTGKSSLLVKFKIPTTQPTPGPARRRSTRARSGSVSARPASSEAQAQGARRSSRIAHDDTEPIVALTDSGRHEDIIRPGTRSPEPGQARPRRGGKSVKTLPTSIVYEETESSGQVRDSIEEKRRTEVAESRDDLDDLADDLQAAATGFEGNNATYGDFSTFRGLDPDEVAVIPESADEAAQDDDEDDDEDPISQPARATRRTKKVRSGESPDEIPSSEQPQRRALRSGGGPRRARKSHRSVQQESSDFEPGFDEGGEEDVSDSEKSSGSPPKLAKKTMIAVAPLLHGAVRVDFVAGAAPCPMNMIARKRKNLQRSCKISRAVAHVDVPGLRSFMMTSLKDVRESQSTIVSCDLIWRCLWTTMRLNQLQHHPGGLAVEARGKGASILLTDPLEAPVDRLPSLAVQLALELLLEPNQTAATTRSCNAPAQTVLAAGLA